MRKPAPRPDTQAPRPNPPAPAGLNKPRPPETPPDRIQRDVYIQDG